MPQSATLQQLLDILEPALPMFLDDAGLSTFPGPEPVRHALAALVADQRNIVERVGAALDARGGAAPRRGYPIRFTALHDVDLASMLPELIGGIERQAVALEALLAAAPSGEDADFVRDALQSARFHGDVLRQLAPRRPAPATAPG